MKGILFTLIFVEMVTLKIFAQQSEELYVPIKITYYIGYGYRIPWEVELDKSIWINFLTYSLTHPQSTRSLYVKDQEEYNKRNTRFLYTRYECDTLVRNYVGGLTSRMKGYYEYGKGAYYIQKRSGDRSYFRCVCIPASELVDIGHGEDVIVGMPIIYLEPKDFVFKFKRYKLDSLDLEEAPYYTIFPMDITPSFDCSKASTPVEKAICRDSLLSAYDRELMTLYRRLLKEKGEEIRQGQRDWLKLREQECNGKNNAEITGILRRMYAARIENLRI